MKGGVLVDLNVGKKIAGDISKFAVVGSFHVVDKHAA